MNTAICISGIREVLEADWWSEKWAQRRADWMNYKEREKNGENRSD
jgi:hypothetical protein